MSSTRTEILDTNAQATVSVSVEGAPVFEYRGAEVIPYLVYATYRYVETKDEDGWTQHRWVIADLDLTCRSAVSGEAVFVINVHHSDELPEWLVELTKQIRPSGMVALPLGPEVP